MVRPSASWNVICVKSIGGIEGEGLGDEEGMLMNTNVEGWRIVVKVERRVLRLFSPGAGVCVVMF